MTDAVIIGAGPAGIAAAIQLKRYGIGFRIFEKRAVGGLLNNANLVENFPGFPSGIAGIQLVKLFEKHLQEHEISVITESVSEVIDKGAHFNVITDKRSYICKIILMATGTAPIQCDAPGALDNDRVFYDVQSLQSVIGRRIAIVGGGDAAFDYAMNLSRHNDVVVNNRSARISAIPILAQRVKEAEKITYRENHSLVKVLEKNDGLELYFGHDNSIDIELYDYLLFAIGRMPNLSCISEQFQDKFSLFEQSGRMHLIGDVKNGLFRQATISIGDGVKAAMQIYRNDNKVI